MEDIALNEVLDLDKLLVMRNTEKRPKVYKIILCVTAGVATLIVVATLCYIFIKNSFSLESLLSLLLAFFSIFISVFFYFKTDETSTRFYETSYNFMKDVSVTLGKIEERFGEKLNNLDDKISHLSDVKEEKTEALQSVEDKKQVIINDLIDKAKLSDAEKEEYKKKLSENEEETALLRRELARIDYQYKKALQENSMLRHDRTDLPPFFLPQKLAKNLQEGNYDVIPTRVIEQLRIDGIIDGQNELTARGQEIIRRSIDRRY